ncbi:MAG: hypothetical protein HQL23_05435 [Candidatus Omnitrophica bacterium]|nr:hypothetical protein [Candidatus Omnitrophota bacterium]
MPTPAENSSSPTPIKQTKFSFGATSAIMTNLGLIVGLAATAQPQVNIIGGILVIALADNISDSLGIHVHQEAEGLPAREVWISTATNFLTRLFISLSFVGLIVFLPINAAVICCVVWGALLLSLMTYAIARSRGIPPLAGILEHLGIALLVIMASKWVSGLVMAKFGK